MTKEGQHQICRGGWPFQHKRLLACFFHRIVHFSTCQRNESVNCSLFCVSGTRGDYFGMIGREYFARQAETLLRMAKTVKDPALSAELLSKAADLEERAAKDDQNPFVPALRDLPEQ
jgi:hypothetical protein